MSIRISNGGLEIYEIDSSGNIIEKGNVESSLEGLQKAQKDIREMQEHIDKKINWGLFTWIVGTLTAVIVVVPATLTQIGINEIKEQTTKLENQDAKLKDQDIKLKDQDAIIRNLELKVNTLEEQIKHKSNK